VQYSCRSAGKECITTDENTETIFTTLIKVLLLFKSLAKGILFCLLVTQLLAIFVDVHKYPEGWRFVLPNGTFREVHPMIGISVLHLFRLNQVFLDYCHEMYLARNAPVALKSESEIITDTDSSQYFDLLRIISIFTLIINLCLSIQLATNKEVPLFSQADKETNEDVKQYRMRLVEENKQQWRNHWNKCGGFKQNSLKRSLEQYPQWLIVEMEEIKTEQTDAQKRQQKFAEHIGTTSWSLNRTTGPQKEKSGMMSGFYNPKPGQSQPSHHPESYKMG